VSVIFKKKIPFVLKKSKCWWK